MSGETVTVWRCPKHGLIEKGSEPIDATEEWACPIFDRAEETCSCPLEGPFEYVPASKLAEAVEANARLNSREAAHATEARHQKERAEEFKQRAERAEKAAAERLEQLRKTEQVSNLRGEELARALIND